MRCLRPAAWRLLARHRESPAHHELEVGEDRGVRAPGTSGFVGSALSPDEGVRNIRRWLGRDEGAARRLFSTSIADAFGLRLPV